MSVRFVKLLLAGFLILLGTPAAAAAPADSSENTPGTFPGNGFVFASGPNLKFVDGTTRSVELLATDPLFGNLVGVVVRPDGSVLVSAVGSDRIYSLDPVTRQLASVVQGADIVNPDGMVLAGDLLYIADLEGKSVLEVNLQTGVRRMVVQNPDLSGIVWLTRDATSLYATLYTQHRVIRINPQTGSYSEVVPPGSVTSPHGITMLPDGYLYVTSLETNTVKRIDPVTGATTTASNANMLSSPLGICAGPDGALYVTNHNGGIIHVDPANGAQTLYASETGSLMYGIAAYPDFSNPVPPAPPAPQNVVASDDRKDGVQITWDPVAGADGYQITRGSTIVATVGPGVTSSFDVPPVGTHLYCVRAFEEFSFSPSTCDDGTRLAPLAPASVVASDDRKDGVSLTWEDVVEEEGYVIARNGEELVVLPADVNEYLDSPPPGTYDYCVRARVGDALSVPTCDSGTRLPPREVPILDFVRDVPVDQGGKVLVAWQRSELDDVSGPNPIVGYRIWRRLPPLAEGGGDLVPASSSARGGSAIRILAGGATTYWEALATLPSGAREGYGYLAATPFDSLPDDNRFTAFFVSALTSDPSVFYDSEIDSGYSVDNLAPAMPSGFAGRLLPGSGVRLRWNPSPDADFQSFALYRGTSESFEPNALSRIATTRDTAHVDPGGGAYHYKISAFDVHGNESAHALLRPVDFPVATLLRELSASEVEDGIEIRFEIATASPGLRTTIWRATAEDRRLAQVLTPDPIAVTSGDFQYVDKTALAGTTYWYWVDVFDEHGLVVSDGPATGVRLAGVPAFTRFDPPAPNPSRAVVTLTFGLAPDLVGSGGVPVRIRVYDAVGRLVRTIDGGTRPWGEHAMTWDGRDTAGRSVRAGMYRLLLEAGDVRRTWPVVRL